MTEAFDLLKFKTEYQENPLAVEARKPRFGWQYPAGSYAAQKSYRITVGTAPDKSDMWDSGVVESENYVAVEYGGKPLESRGRYFASVTATDKDGKTYRSGQNFFETAIYNQSEWKGSWVSVPANFNGGTLLFRKKITLDQTKEIARARAYICGLGYHEFFVNGKKAGNALLDPAISEYSKRVFYRAYDMQNLRKGDNVVGIELGYGWLGSRKLLAQFYVEYADGSVYEDHSGPAYGWWVGGSPTVDNSIYGGEVYDARIEDVYPRNWNTLDYEPTWGNGWMYTIAAAAPAGKLEAQQIEPIEVCASYPEKERTELEKGVCVIDVGANIAGRLRIKVKGRRGSAVTLKFGEQLRDDGRVNRLNLRSARCSDKYILRGEGVEEWAPRFTYHGFRYVQAEIKGNAEILEAVGEHVHTATRSAGTFECSCDTLNKLHEIAVRTERNNEHSILTDCPQRDERFGWLNDLSSRIYQTMYNVDMARFIPKFIRDITDSQTAEGAIADTVPYYTGGIPADPVCVIYPLLAVYANRYYGDSNTCLSEYEGVKKWVDYLLSRSDGYITNYTYYGDWVYPYPDIKADGIYVSSAFLYWHLKEMTRLAEIAGNSADAAEYRKHAENSAKALNAKYFRAETNDYCNGLQTENALAVSLGFAPENARQAIADNIYRDCVKRGHHCTSGNVGYRHVFYVLAEYGYAEEVIAILRNPEYPGWGYMIANGATSVWERWEAEMQNEMHSFNHPMFGSYDAFLYRFLAGINVCDDAVACDKITIEPVFAQSLDFVRGSLDTVRGRIVSEWKRENGKIALRVVVPHGTSAEIKFAGNVYRVGAGEYKYER